MRQAMPHKHHDPAVPFLPSIWPAAHRLAQYQDQLLMQQQQHSPVVAGFCSTMPAKGHTAMPNMPAAPAAHTEMQ
jgi:hypothetical protein